MYLASVLGMDLLEQVLSGSSNANAKAIAKLQSLAASKGQAWVDKALNDLQVARADRFNSTGHLRRIVKTDQKKAEKALERAEDKRDEMNARVAELAQEQANQSSSIVGKFMSDVTGKSSQLNDAIRSVEQAIN